MANKFREFVDAKSVTVKIHFPSKDYAKTFGDIIKNIENEVRFNTAMENYKFKVELIGFNHFGVIEQGGKNILMFTVFVNKSVNPAFLDCQTFFMKTPTIATTSFYCEIIDNEINKLAYKAYKNDLVSKIKLL